MAVVLLCLVSSLITLIYYFYTRQPRDFPPGPRGFPILGCLPLLQGPWHKIFYQWEKQYGKIVGFHVGPRPFILITKAEDMRRILSMSEFKGKPLGPYDHDRTLGESRGLLSNGKRWLELRRFTVRMLKDFGMGKVSMEGIIMDQVERMLEVLEKRSAQQGVISTSHLFPIFLVGSLWTILTGEQLEADDLRMITILNGLTDLTRNRPMSSILEELFPLMRKLGQLFPSAYTIRRRKFLHNFYNMLDSIVASHRNTWNPDSPTDFIDAFLTKVSETADEDSAFYSHEGELTLKVALFDLFVAGLETSTAVLTWACLLLALNPDKQKRVQEEIDALTAKRGPSAISLADRKQLEYVEATVMEALRIGAVSAPMHFALENAEFDGYKIPKGTTILFNVREIMNSPDYWVQPESFQPERFLNPDDGSILIPPKVFMPFGAGKRACLGENLAKAQLFLFLSNICSNFEICWPAGQTQPSLDNVAGFPAAFPPQHELEFRPRVGKILCGPLVSSTLA